jgi:hypothetical protein
MRILFDSEIFNCTAFILYRGDRGLLKFACGIDVAIPELHRQFADLLQAHRGIV